MITSIKPKKKSDYSTTMKNSGLIKKIGILTLIGVPLALGLGFNPKNSQGLESKLPSISMSVAEAETTYESPTKLGMDEETGFEAIRFEGEKYWLAKSKSKDRNDDGILETNMKFYVNNLKGKPTKYIIEQVTAGKTWVWGILLNPSDRSDLINNYTIIDTDVDGDFDKKIAANKPYGLPKILA